MDVKESEEKILNYWEDKDIYNKVRDKNKKGKKFYFMDGPPYATGHIHMGTALNKILKDVIMRSQRLQGKDVFDRPGYDTHGVPIEFQVEKEIGSKGKQDIEKYGVDKFVKKCKEYATKHIDVMNDEFKNLGVWMDWSDPYITLDDRFIEAIWHSFKKADEKKLLYLGKYPVHVCTRCQTAVAYNEIEYYKQKDSSIFVKFKLNDKDNTYLIIWTTTPWTLPGNTGVMAHPDAIYQEVEVAEGEKWIIAKDRIPELMAKLERGFTVKNEYLGKDMEGWTYTNPLKDNVKINPKNSYRVVLSGRYVTTEDGTGLVHCAPGHGKEDFEVGNESGLDNPCPVGIDGLMTEEAGKYVGKQAREVNSEIISDLEEMGSLVYRLEFEHDYPMCWRDKTPLLMVSQPQWFFKISSIKEKILEESEKVDWIPKYMGLRMKGWLEGIGDWPVSRQRYWGTPLPIWVSEDGDKIVVGSLAELEKLSGKKVKDLHKPHIDEIIIKKDGKIYKRVPEVLDVWFDSGVSSWAALGYPHDKKKFDKFWPADLNIEGKDQFRGWWNSQIILSQITFDRRPFENIMVHGMVTDISKRKMSKSEGNSTPPEEVIEKFGRDFLRYYMAKLSKGEDFSYDEKEFREIAKVGNMFGNTLRFISQIEPEKEEMRVEDEWILSRYNSFLKNVREKYDLFKLPEVIQEFEKFLNELSREYIQIIRDRSGQTKKILDEIGISLLKCLSPVMPFFSESKWLELKENKIVKEESINLSSWPEFDQDKINLNLEAEFDIAFKIIEAGLRERDKSQIGLRWPLSEAKITSETDLSSDVKEIICRQLNVKKISLKKKKGDIEVVLEKKMTPELESEGFAREIARKVQAERKNNGFKKGELVNIKISCDSKLHKILEDKFEFLKDRTNAKELSLEVGKSFGKDVFTVKERQFTVDFS